MSSKPFKNPLYTVACLNESNENEQNGKPSKKITPKSPNTSLQKNILKEETYIDSLNEIIKRDFFPDLPKIEAQFEYLQAFEKSDWHAMGKAVKKLEYLQSSFHKLNNEEGTKNNSNSFADLSLDEFQVVCTSDDNASFELLLKKMNEERRQKYEWIYTQIKKNPSPNLKPSQLLTQPESMTMISNTSELTHSNEPLSNDLMVSTTNLSTFPIQPEPRVDGTIETWNYTIKNSLMYPPENLSNGNGKIIEPSFKAINYKNTRLESHASSLNNILSSDIEQYYFKIYEEYKNVDIIKNNSNQYPPPSSGQEKNQFVSTTPLLIPGKNITPLMTWGTIESTPLPLNSLPVTPSQSGSTTPSPSFKIPPTRPREKIGHQLSTKASVNMKKRLNSSTPSRPRSKLSPKSLLMSPAGKRLVSSIHKSSLKSSQDFDYQLRASYNPKSPYYDKKSNASSSSNRSMPSGASSPSHSYRHLNSKPD